mgnify:CR=1 FL=1
MKQIQHELIMPNEDLPFKMFIFEGREGNYIREKHWHRSIEIFAVFQGTLEFYLNDQEYLLGCGDFIIVNSNEVHSIHAPKENMTVVLQMSLDMFEKYYTGDQFICFAHAPQAQDEQLMENGFPNNKAFSKAFYKKYGMMPAQFRKGQKSAINKISN